jgi:hypothetical protein
MGLGTRRRSIRLSLGGEVRAIPHLRIEMWGANLRSIPLPDLATRQGPAHRDKVAMNGAQLPIQDERATCPIYAFLLCCMPGVILRKRVPGFYHAIF